MILQKSGYETGDILLYENLGDDSKLVWAFGELVKYATNSQYVHVAIYLGEHEDFGSIVAESIASGFLIKTQSNLGHKQLRYKEGLTKNQKDKIIYNSLSMSGYQYGYIDLIKIVIYKLTKQNIYSSTNKKLTCSEAIARVYGNMGIKLVEKKDYDLVYPVDIVKSNKLVEIP